MKTMRRHRVRERDTSETLRPLGDGYKVVWLPASHGEVPWTLYRYSTFASRGIAPTVAEAIGQAKHAAARHARRQASYASSGSAARDKRMGRDAGLDKKALQKAIDADLKAKDKAKIHALRKALATERKADAKRCGQAKTTDRLHRTKIQQKAAWLVAVLRAERARARAKKAVACAPRSRAAAQSLREERRHQASLQRSAQGARARRRPGIRKTRAETSSESDDAVRHNIPPHLVPLWNRVKRGIKAGPRISRTDAFLLYAEEHPEEVYADMDDATDALIADLERQQRAGRDSLPSIRGKRMRRRILRRYHAA